MQFSAFC